MPKSSREIVVKATTDETGEEGTGQVVLYSPQSSTRTTGTSIRAAKKARRPPSEAWNHFSVQEGLTCCNHCHVGLPKSKQFQAPSAEEHLILCQEYEKEDLAGLLRLVEKHKRLDTTATRYEPAKRRIRTLISRYARLFGSNQQIIQVDTCSKEEKEALDEKILSFVYESGSAFRIVEHESFRNLLGAFNPAYPIAYAPSRKSVASMYHITKKYNEIKGLVEEEIMKWSAVTISADGWTAVDRRGLVNVCFLGNNGAVYFANAYDFTNQSATSQNLVKVLKPHLQCRDPAFMLTNLGETKINGVVSDSAANYSKAREILAEIFIFMGSHYSDRAAARGQSSTR